MKRIGIVGSGFIAKGLTNLLLDQKEFLVSSVLTKSDTSQRDDFPIPSLLTNSIDKLLKSSDLIVECSGDVLNATIVINEAVKMSLPVVTMNSEFHVTTGSFFVGKGLVTEAEGDQPGCIAALNEEVLAMGFSPLVYGNIKGFLNENPTREEMHYWSKKQGISLDMVTSFTDGTKIQIEQALIANGLQSAIAQESLIGLASSNYIDGANTLAEHAKNVEHSISDYILCPTAPPGVFVTAQHQDNQKASLKYYKMGEGPFYTFLKNYHLCHFEILKTIKRVLNGGGILLDNSSAPTVSVATVAKRDLKAGEKILKGIGSFDVRGVAVNINDYKNHIPIGLVNDVKLTKDIKKGEKIFFDDVELKETLATEAWRSILKSL